MCQEQEQVVSAKIFLAEVLGSAGLHGDRMDKRGSEEGQMEKWGSEEGQMEKWGQTPSTPSNLTIVGVMSLIFMGPPPDEIPQTPRSLPGHGAIQWVFPDIKFLALQEVTFLGSMIFCRNVELLESPILDL